MTPQSIDCNRVGLLLAAIEPRDDGSEYTLNIDQFNRLQEDKHDGLLDAVIVVAVRIINGKLIFQHFLNAEDFVSHIPPINLS